MANETLEQLEKAKKEALEKLRAFKRENSFKGAWTQMRKDTAKIYYKGGKEADRKAEIVSYLDAWLVEQE